MIIFHFLCEGWLPLGINKNEHILVGGCFVAMVTALGQIKSNETLADKDLSVLTKFALAQQVVRTCFCDCLTKCIARARWTNQKTTKKQLLLCFPELLDKF